MFYPNLEFLILKRGIKQKAMADALRISVRCLYNKIKGAVAFTWPEVCTIQKEFFPDVSKEKLFATDTDQKTSA